MHFVFFFFLIFFVYLFFFSKRSWNMISVIVFFFQAEDGIRDTSVTGVQTCALPICETVSLAVVESCAYAVWPDFNHAAVAVTDGRKGEQIVLVTTNPDARRIDLVGWARSEERRVGKECGCRGWTGEYSKKQTTCMLR